MQLTFIQKHDATTRKSFFLGFFAVIVVVCALIVMQSKRASISSIVRIPEGTSIIQAGSILKEHKVIRSRLFFRAFAQINRVPIKAGSYLFQEHEGLFSVIQRLSVADYGDVYVRVTLPEGATSAQMGAILEKAELPLFDKEEFIKLTEDEEGYLFPDTYFFLPDHNAEDIFHILTDTFDEKIAELDFDQSDRSFEDIVIMASLVQKEAGQDLEEKKVIAGILWKRIDQGMLLQVDAPFVYAIGKGSAELRTSDLTTDHPYNTYVRQGLTPGPIANPGLDALRAALEPTASAYFFYLHDSNGGIHYGRNYNEHLSNKRRYIN